MTQLRMRSDASQDLPDLHIPLQAGTMTAVHASTEKQQEMIRLLMTRAVLFREDDPLKPEELGLLLLEEGHYPRLRVHDHLTFYQQIYGGSLPIQTAVDLLQLREYKKERMDRLSYSVQRRVNAARLLFQEASVYVVEEIEQNIDIDSKKILRQLLRRLTDQGSAVLLLTGNMESAVSAADVVYRLTPDGMKQANVEVEGEEDDPPGAGNVRFSKIPAKLEEKIVLFDPPEIDYIESRDGRTCLHLEGDMYPCAYTLKELEEKLATFGFFRCHRSYLVNLQKVREVMTWTKNSYSLQLANEQKSEVPLSKQKMEELKQIFDL
ncbi:LytTR family transcriptional regulator DNA-binding domain-containing protein [Alkalicoccus chagannorensis]|uniref:LytTR family transcriptional regulator DNA-binding domain-containing protein n=1 Tax=Alkalicoccus chagannorensis TaxID=427072 RepID=UPI00047ADF8F|nr:LytTR family transcriptional regulator DNA-binding domain-containing protein [Alkalicoccus chagannorensis]